MTLDEALSLIPKVLADVILKHIAEMRQEAILRDNAYVFELFHALPKDQALAILRAVEARAPGA